MRDVWEESSPSLPARLRVVRALDADLQSLRVRPTAKRAVEARIRLLSNAFVPSAASLGRVNPALVKRFALLVTVSPPFYALKSRAEKHMLMED